MEIRDLGHDTFLVGRRVIKAGVPGMFDLSKQADREELCRLSSRFCTSGREPRCFGELTVCVVRPVQPENLERFPNARYEKSQCHFCELRESAKKILREVFPEYADCI